MDLVVDHDSPSSGFSERMTGSTPWGYILAVAAPAVVAGLLLGRQLALAHGVQILPEHSSDKRGRRPANCASHRANNGRSVASG